MLKGRGNEADFLEFLQKLVPHRPLTLRFEPFRFWLRICGDIRNQKTTLRLGESGVDDSPTRRIGESAFECLKENRSRYSNFLKFIIELQHFKRLNEPFKGPIWPKISLGCNVLCLKTIVSIGNLVDSPTRRVGQSFFYYEHLHKFEVKIGTARNLV